MLNQTGHVLSSSCQTQSDDLRMYSSCSCISLSITLCSLWSVYNEQSLAHISSELINMDVLSTESAGPLSLEKHINYDIWLTASVSMLQLSNLTFTRRACARFDINNAKHHWSLCTIPMLLMWICAWTKEYTAARSKCYSGILYILLVSTTTLYTTSIYEYLN